MTAEQFGQLLIEAYAGISYVGWHWFAYHFNVGPTPFAKSIIEACAEIDDHAPSIGTELLREMTSIGGRKRDEAHLGYSITSSTRIRVSVHTG
jgi:hypothetical protein